MRRKLSKAEKDQLRWMCLEVLERWKPFEVYPSLLSNLRNWIKLIKTPSEPFKSIPPKSSLTKDKRLKAIMAFNNTPNPPYSVKAQKRMSNVHKKNPK